MLLLWYLAQFIIGVAFWVYVIYYIFHGDND